MSARSVASRSRREQSVLWLTDVPDDWDVAPLFSRTRVRNESNEGMREQNLLSLSYGQIVRKDIAASEGLLPASYETYQVVHDGDIVFRFTDLQNDQRSLRSALVGETGIVTSAYLALAPRRGLQPRFFSYLMRAYDLRKVFYGQVGGVRQGIKFADIRRLPILVPPLDEQRAIADYLDDATSRIDNLIAKQHEMVGLLVERRSHVLASTTTLIDAPLVALRRLCRLMGGVGFPHSAQGDQSLEIPFYKVKALGGIRSDGGIGGASDTVSRATAAALGAAIIPAGSLAFAKVGAALLMGRVGTLPGPSCIDNNMAALVPSPDVESAFLRHALLRFPFSEFANPGAVPSLAMKPLMDFKVNVPSISDQRAAVTRVDAETAKIDALIAKTREHIALAKERRSALITAAVTGQFDVRIATREVA